MGWENSVCKRERDRVEERNAHQESRQGAQVGWHCPPPPPRPLNDKPLSTDKLRVGGLQQRGAREGWSMPCRHNTGEAVGWHVPPAIKQTDNLVPIPTGRRPSRFKGMGRDRTAHRWPGRCKSGRQLGQYKSRRTSGYLAGRQGHGRAHTGGSTDQPDSSNNPRYQAKTAARAI